MSMTTLRTRSGPPGLSDTDYEYLYTDEPPTEEELRDFARRASQSCSDVRWTSTHTAKLDA